VDTTSTYIQSINEEYPVAGKVNDAKGFHNNFSSIKSALANLDTEIQTLTGSSVLKFQNNDFGGYNLKNLNLINGSVTIAPQGDGTDPIDSSIASFWPITLLTSGTNVLTISPVTSNTATSGHVIVSITTSSVNTQVVFTATTGTVISIGHDDQPFNLTANPCLFEIWNDYSNTLPTVYIKKISVDLVGALNSQTHYKLIGTNYFYGKIATFNSATISLADHNFNVNPIVTATVITNGTTYGNVGVVPNKITTIITGTNVASADGVSTEVCVLNAAGIYPGATFYFLGTTTQYSVTGASVGTLIPTSQYDVRDCNIGDPITFINHQYLQPTIATVTDVAAGDEYGVLSTGTDYNLAGSIYATENSLQVTFSDPNGTGPNTFSIDKAITATNTSSNDLVTVGYVNHYIPQGAVIMWYNSKNKIPYGWQLCDGSVAPNGVTTPNLSNRFIVGAGDERITTSTIALSTQTFAVPLTNITGTYVVSGGTSASVLLAHGHDSTGTTVALQDPGHQHLGVGSNQYAGHIQQPEGPFPGPNGSGSGPYGSSFWGFTENGTTGTATQWWNSKENVFLDQHLPQSEPQSTGIILKTTVDVASTGTVDVENFANLPPYRALYFIYKWSGQTFSGGF